MSSSFGLIAGGILPAIAFGVGYLALGALLVVIGGILVVRA